MDVPPADDAVPAVQTAPSPLRWLWLATLLSVLVAGIALIVAIARGSADGAVACFSTLLFCFAAFKTVVASDALLRRRQARRGVPGVLDPTLRHRPRWLFWGWIGWRYAAAICAVGAGSYLLGHPGFGARLINP